MEQVNDITKEVVSEVNKIVEKQAENTTKNVTEIKEKVGSIENKVVEVEKSTNEKLEKIEKQLDLNGKTIANIMNQATSNSKAENKVVKKFVKQVEEQFVAKLAVEGKMPDFNTAKFKDISLQFKYTQEDVEAIYTKAAHDITRANSLLNNVIQHPFFTNYSNTIEPIPDSIKTQMIDVIRKEFMNADIMTLPFESQQFNGVGYRTEGNSSVKSDLDLDFRQFNMLSVGTHFKFSRERANTWRGLYNAIARVAFNKIRVFVTEQILAKVSGNGTTAMYSIFSTNIAEEFVATAKEITSCNIIDLIGRMKLQARDNEFVPNAVLLNSEQITEISELRDKEDNSLMDRRVKFDDNGMPFAVCGMRIIETLVPDNCLAVITLAKLQIGVSEDFYIELGYNNDGDFAKKLLTAVPEMRCAFGSLNPSAHIFSKDVTADIATLASANS